MKKLLTLSLLFTSFAFNEAKASEGEAGIITPKNGDCVVMIVQSLTGKDTDLKFLEAIQDHLENGYVAKSSFSMVQRSSRKQLYIPLFKEDC